MKINPQLTSEKASYISDLYTIDCRLGTNPFGPPPLAPDFMYSSLLEGVESYYSFDWIARLSVLVSGYTGVPPDQLYFSNGSMPMLSNLFFKMFTREGKTMLGIGPQFVDAVSEWSLSGGSYQSLAMADYADTASLFDALEKKVRIEQPDVVYLDNPNNPTGFAWPKALVRELAAACDEVGSYLLIDEAYGDFLAPESSLISLCCEYNHTLVVRSFSKGLGLAALRLGYVAVPKGLVGVVRNTIIPFTPSLPAIKVACHVLPGIATYIRTTVDKTREYKAKLIEALEQNGITVLPTHSDTPIFLAHAKNFNLYQWLADKGIQAESGHHFRDTWVPMSHHYCRIRIPGNEHDLAHLCYRLGVK